MQTPPIPPKRGEFAIQAAPEQLTARSTMTAEEGRQRPALAAEALHDSVERMDNTPRESVVQALHASMAQFDSLYRELSK